MRGKRKRRGKTLDALVILLTVQFAAGTFFLPSANPVRASSNIWTQTSQADFSGGTTNGVDAATSPGDIVLRKPGWWNSNYRYAAKITVATGARAATNGYSVSINALDTSALISAGKLRADGNDLRAVYWNGSGWTELDRDVVGFNTTSTSVWFRLQADIGANANDDSYYMFYGHSGETGTPPADKSRIYGVWDDFSGSAIDGAKWVSRGSVAQAGGFLTIGTSSNSDIYGTTAFNGAVFEAKLKWGSSTSTFVFGGLSNAAIDHFMFWHSNNWQVYAYNKGVFQNTIPGVITDPLNWHAYKIRWEPSVKTEYSIDGGPVVAAQTSTVPGIDLVPLFHVFSPGFTLSVDDVKVRRYVNPEPTATLGAEKTSFDFYASRGTLISSAFDAGGISNFNSISWNASVPANTALKFQVRTALTQAQLASSTWSGPAGASDYYASSGSAINAGNSPSRWIQYKLFFSTADETATPLLSDVAVGYATNPSPPGAAEPILVLTDGASANAFHAYVSEILNAEGDLGYQALDISLYDPSLISSSYLAGFDIVILTNTAPLAPSVVSALAAYAANGGNLIGLRPDTQLASVFGLASLGTTTSEKYMAVDTATAIGNGITSSSMQFHGDADNYGLNGASAVAMLYSNATTSMANPAVTLFTYGSGRTVAFAYDLAKSTVLFRQGQFANRSGDANGDGLYMPDDLFQNYLDQTKANIPQADEQQMILTNAIEYLSALKKPLPRLWYYPNKAMSLAWITGDGDQATLAEIQAYADITKQYGGYYTYFEGFENQFSAGMNAALQADGHSIAKHPDLGCAKPTLAEAQSGLTGQIQGFITSYGHQPLTDREHCFSWAGWTEEAKYLAENGVRINSNFASVVANTGDKAYLNGSGLPMKFMDENGAMVDLYEQSTTFYEKHDPAIVDQSLGTYHSVLTYSFHPVNENIPLISSAASYSQSKGIPLVSGDAWANFVDARRAMQFKNIRFSASGSTVSFDIQQGSRPISDATIMIPAAWGARSVQGIQENGAMKSYATSTVVGAQYALFNVSLSPGQTKSYAVQYDLTPPAAFALIAPQNASDITNQPQFSWAASSDAGSGLLKYQLYVDDNLRIDDIPTSTTSVSFPGTLSCGNHSWYAAAVDNAGNSTRPPAAGFSMACNYGGAIFFSGGGVPGNGAAALPGRTSAGTSSGAAAQVPAAPDGSASLSSSSAIPKISGGRIVLTLRYGSRGNQVMLLQDKLKKIGFFPRAIKSSGNFGPITSMSVKNFQLRLKIARSGEPGYGQVGPKTRQAINALPAQGPTP